MASRSARQGPSGRARDSMRHAMRRRPPRRSRTSRTSRPPSADVCSDGNQVHVVDRGAGIPNGAQSQGRSTGVIPLVREDDGRQVDGNVIEEGRC